MNLKSKYLWIVFGVALCAVVPLRIYQLFFLMDERGFYTDGDMISWILMGILFASLAFFFVLSIKNKSLPKRYTHKRSAPSGLAHLGAGIAAVVYSVREVISLALPSDSATALSGGFLYVAIILALVGVGGGIVWIVMGIASLVNRNLIRMLPTAGILPAIWLAIMLFTNVVQFSGNNIALNSTEHIYDTMTIILMTMFSFNECKMVAGAQGKKCGKRIHAYGFPMILFGVVSALPSFVGLATGIGSTNSFDLIMSIMIGFLCIAAAIFLFLVPRGKDAYVEELIEIVPEEEKEKEEEAEEPQADGKTPAKGPAMKTTSKGISRKDALRAAVIEQIEAENAPDDEDEKKGPKQPWPLRAMHALLDFMASIVSKEGRKKKRKGKLFEAGELDEKATMGMSDEQWRLDFYGIRDDEGPFYPTFYKLPPNALEERKRKMEEAILEARIYEEELREEMRHKRGKKSRDDEPERKPWVQKPVVPKPTVPKPTAPKPSTAKPAAPKPEVKKTAPKQPEAPKQQTPAKQEPKQPQAKKAPGKQPQQNSKPKTNGGKNNKSGKK